MTLKRRRQIENKRIKTMVQVKKLVQQGYSYTEIARMLKMPESKVRYCDLKAELYS